MAIEPKVINVTFNPDAPDNVYTVTIRLQDNDTLKYLGPAYQISADNKTEMKDKIRPHLQEFLEEQAQQETLRSIAQSALDELIAELGF